MKRFAALTFLAVLLGASLGGCIIVPPHDHPHHDHDDGYYR